MAVTQAQLQALSSEVQTLERDLAEATRRANDLTKRWQAKSQELNTKTTEFQKDAAAKMDQAKKLADSLRS